MYDLGESQETKAAAPIANPCNSITNLTCGSVGMFNFSGTGAWNPPGPWGTPGEEQVFSFTPTVSGTHQVAVANQGGYVDLFAKTGLVDLLVGLISTTSFQLLKIL